MAHMCRMENDQLQKQVLFELKTPANTWKKVEELLGVDKQQTRGTMTKKRDFMCLLGQRFPRGKR